MNYILLSDLLWFFGHVLTGSSIIFTEKKYYLALSCILIGLRFTIISRPIGRINSLCYPEEQNKELEIWSHWDLNPGCQIQSLK